MSLTIEQATHHFSQYLRVERQASPQTHDNYVRDLKKLSAQHPELSINNVDAGHIRQVIAHLHMQLCES